MQARQNATAPYSEQLVLRVNELFFNAANEGYKEVHEEMESHERERWIRLAQRFLQFDKPITLIDIGSGTGFVPLVVAPLMKAEDTVVCSDLSDGMLEIARRNIAAQTFRCRFSFKKIEGSIPYHLPFETASAEVITMNSVLHHIKETDQFLDEIDRVLQPGGLLFIAHEPNQRFRTHSFLWHNYQALRPLTNPRLVLMEWARKLGVSSFLRRILYRLRPDRKRKATALIDGINRRLLAEKLIDRPITMDEIGTITDIRDQEGFDPEQLRRGYELLHLETYNHMLLVTIKHLRNSLIQRYELWLRRKYPDAGATFFLVLRKPAG
jgi:ubiquinone/menaquinone biosynthesis C-methylase UbiE